MNVITRKEAEKYLGISIENGDPVDILIGITSARLAEFCGRDDWGPATERTEYFDGNTGMLLAKVWPLVSVVSINDDPEHDWDADTVIDATSYHAGSMGVIYYEYGKFLAGNESIKLVYTGGYANEAAIPSKVKKAALTQLKNDRLGNQIVTQPLEFGTPVDDGLLPEVIALMQPFVRRVMF